MICYTCAKKIIFFRLFWDNLKYSCLQAVAQVAFVVRQQFTASVADRYYS
jgi:hypothetical protein